MECMSRTHQWIVCANLRDGNLWGAWKEHCWVQEVTVAGHRSALLAQRYKVRCGKETCLPISMFNYDVVPGNTAPGISFTVTVSICICVSVARQPRQEELRSNSMTRILLVQCGNPMCPQGSRPTHTGGREVGRIRGHTDSVACDSLSHGRWGEPHWIGFLIFNWEGSCACLVLLRECHGNRGKPHWGPARWHLGGSCHPGLLARTASQTDDKSQGFGWPGNSAWLQDSNGVSEGCWLVGGCPVRGHGHWHGGLDSTPVIVRVMGLACG